MALGVALNGLSVIPWPAKVLGGLVSLVERVDVALDQMRTGSDFLKALAALPDPMIPYTVLAGETSVRQPPGDAKRDGDLVADAAVRQDYDRLAVAGREHAGHARDHRAPVAWRKNAACRVATMRCANATATPSAASAGVGADLSRRSWATM